MRGACTQRPMYTGDTAGNAYPGQYDVLVECGACLEKCCWGCVHAERESPSLLCPRHACRGVLRVTPDVEAYGAQARVHTFIHEVLDGDFSQASAPEPGGGREDAIIAIIARYVLRGHVCVAAQYLCCYSNEENHTNAEDTARVCQRVCVLAGTMLETYDIRAVVCVDGGNPAITAAALNTHPPPVARNAYAQNVFTFYRLMTDIIEHGVTLHCTLE